MRKFGFLVAAATATLASPALAAPGDPVAIGDGVTLDPIVDGVLRYEHVSQPDTPADAADALTLRIRSGAELVTGGLSLLGEVEATLAIVDDYNDTIPGNNGYLGAEPYSVVADPQNIELNRLQIGYKSAAGTALVLGRQRIVLDDSRFVGNVGWRQNEQTFDALRGMTKLGPVALDASWSISQRTIFGTDSPREHYDGNFYLINAGVDVQSVAVKGFAYLLDFDTALASSSQTYGLRASGGVPLGEAIRFNYAASFARQTDYGDNPVDYTADYGAAEIGIAVAGFGISGGFEILGSDDGVAAFQTPLATLHKFNGWADLFLTTPADGIEDYYVTVGKSFDGVKLLPGLNASVTWHKFDSDVGGLSYGTEWDAAIGFKIRSFAILAKYANYDAKDFGTDTEKFWLQAAFKY